jgi:molecular chaperone GrpE
MSENVEDIENLPVNDAQAQEEAKEEIQPTEENNWQYKYNTLNDNYLRLMAEYDNYRKRTLKEKSELIRNGGENVIMSLLSIIDNFERAIQTIENTTDKEGIELIYQQLTTTLKRHGLKEIDTEKQKFDTEFHEALTTIPATTDEQKGEITDTIQKGYILNDKVIRHAKVVVGE